MEPSDVPDPNATVLYVGNLDRLVTDQMMLNILKTGLPHISDKVVEANMRYADPNTGMDGHCFVHFTDNNSACQAMTFLNGREFCGKKVKVNWATSPSNGGPPKVIGSSVTIFCGDLDDEISDTELRKAFDPFGEILNAKVVTDPATRKSKNYGFVSFSNKPDAEKAIRDMNGVMLGRRPIKTNWASRNNQSAKPSQYSYDEVYQESNEENCTVYITNLPDRITDETLKQHFNSFGTVVGNPRLFEGKNFAFIRFEDHSQATTAIVKGNGSELFGAILKCWWGKESSEHTSSSSNHNNFHSSNTSSHANNFNMSSQMNGSNAPSAEFMQNAQSQMSPQQYMAYMQQYQQAYQQHYYQYWMQQYQLMQQGMSSQQQQQQGGFNPYQQQQQQQWQQNQQNGGQQQNVPQSVSSPMQQTRNSFN